MISNGSGEATARQPLPSFITNQPREAVASCASSSVSIAPIGFEGLPNAGSLRSTTTSVSSTTTRYGPIWWPISSARR
jgi:hypothetical protein